MFDAVLYCFRREITTDSCKWIFSLFWEKKNAWTNITISKITIYWIRSVVLLPFTVQWFRRIFMHGYTCWNYKWIKLFLFLFPVPENADEKLKRCKIESALLNPNTTLSQWQEFAKSDYGLINGNGQTSIAHSSDNIIDWSILFVDDLRRHVWPRLVGIDPNCVDPAPNLHDLKLHPEYNQVILDVNRSLKRFPPGIPYKQRIALQDQLTVLILRVIKKYPHLRYYQVWIF